MELIRSHRPTHVLVLAGDHIYKMDYGPMIAYHVEKGADITVGVVAGAARAGARVRRDDRRRSGTASSSSPRSRRTRTRFRAASDVALASMGIYVFNTRLLEKLLTADAENRESAHDFGRNIIPGRHRATCRCSRIRSRT